MRMFAQELQEALEGIDHGPFSESVWADIAVRVIRPMVRSLLGCGATSTRCQSHCGILGDEVALADALALEAMRIFAQDSYAKLPAAVPALTGEDRSSPSPGDEGQVRELVDAAREHKEAISDLCRLLFPATGGLGGTRTTVDTARARRETRVAHPDILRIYIRRSLPEGTTPARVVQEAFRSLGNPTQFAPPRQP